MTNENKKNRTLKIFFIKLISITIAIIIILNITYNLIFAQRLEKINFIMNLNKKENIEIIKDKIREEIKSGLEKDKILNDEDSILLNKLFLKLRNEFKNAN